MALNFPAAPVSGQVYTAEGVDFVWNGALWVLMSAANFPWATAAEAIAGARNNAALSPATFAATDNLEPVSDGYIRYLPVTVSRAKDTDYQNDLGEPLLMIVIIKNESGGNGRLLAGPSLPVTLNVAGQFSQTPDRPNSMTALIPTGWFYRFQSAGVNRWIEYRGAP